jgi:hypothetical protein
MLAISTIRERAISPYLAEGVPNGTRLATTIVPAGTTVPAGAVVPTGVVITACVCGEVVVEPVRLLQPFRSSAIRRIMGRMRFILSNPFY